MTDPVQEIPGLPVNAEGSIVAVAGTGSSTVVGTLQSGYFPVDVATGGLVIKFPEVTVVGDMLQSLYDPNHDGKIDIAQLTGAEPTLTKGSIAGTANQVLVNNGSNASNAIIGSNITLTLPQDIAQGSSPSFNALKLSPTPTSPPTIAGAVFYDAEYKTLAVNTGVPGVVLQVGQENHLLCINKTGGSLSQGTIVYINGSFNNYPTIAKAVNTDYTKSNGVIGMLTSNSSDGEFCMVTLSGIVHDVNTSSYSPGTVIYLDSVAGAFTSTKPTTDKTNVRIGYVLKQDASNGEILVDKQIEMNSEGSAVDAQVRTASVAIPTTPTLFVWDTEVNDSIGMYNSTTGEFTIPFNGNFTFVFLYNAATSGSAKQLYSAAQYWNGSAWVNLEYSCRQLNIAQSIKDVATFVSTNPFTAGTIIRFVTWASTSGVSIITESPATGFTIPAARIMVTGVKTI